MSRWNPFRRFSRRGERRHDAPEDRAATAPAMPPWDGGWRRSAAQDGVLGRGGLGVIQPARFRSSVVSFRDHGVLGGELGHRLSADAPAGTMHGLVRPPTAPVQRAAVPGGAAVTPAAPGPNVDSTADLPFAAADPGADSAGFGELDVAPVQRSAVRTRRLAPPLTRARPVTGLTPRRLPAASTSGTAAPALVQRTPSATAPRRDAAVPTAPEPDDTGIDLAVQRPASAGNQARRPASPSSEVRPTSDAAESRPALGDPIQRLPSGAVPLHRDSAPGEPPVEPTSPVTASDPMPQVVAPDPMPQATSSGSAPSTAPQRPASRRRPAANVQRATPSAGSTQGIGAPLAELPKSATPLGPHAPNGPRTGAPSSAGPAAPADPPAHDGEKPVVPAEPASASSSTPGSAPLLGATPQVQRLLRETTATTDAAARRSEQDPPGVVTPGTGAPEVPAPGTTPPVQRIRRSPHPSEDAAHPQPMTSSAADAGAVHPEAATTDSPVVQRSSTAADTPRTRPAQPLDPPVPTEPDTSTAAVQRLAEPSPGRAAPANSAAGGDVPRPPRNPVDARSGPAATDRPGPTAPLVGDSPTVQRLSASARNPVPPATSSTVEPTALTTSRPPHDPGRADDGPPEPPTTSPDEQAPIQRSVVPLDASSPNDLVVPRADRASANQAPSTGSSDAPSAQRALPLPSTASPDSAPPRSRPRRPVQRVLPLIATRPLPVRTHHAQTGSRTPPNRSEDAPAVAPLRWGRPDERAPSPSAPPRIANPPPVQRSPAAPRGAAVGEGPPRAGKPVAPTLAAPTVLSAVDAPATPESSPPLAVQRRSTPPAQEREAPPAPTPSTSTTEATPPIPGVPPGVPVTVVPTEHEPATDDTQAASNDTGGDDVDELARRLVEPVGRLLRTELRHGRERFGRTYDRRR
ncbi:hypothetical protein OOZ19_21305 [Saccharopolyspora sp. NFXS83]|uniref:hypothetical protein n=1 Tax=Saccharopolyspora sp. NFXS83 TaxID=2993560 RepID=UPI00224A63FF|nr:hypothetical protein [Saccharopolyspora sp. NFXS83]MCX2732784.1 hypothetical protein [Saccharopolyspora sp. NFXS83]